MNLSALSQYKTVPYVDGGRVVSDDPEKNGLDCFGLVRHALHYVFDGPLLDSFFGIFRADLLQMTNEFNAAINETKPAIAQGYSFELCRPEAGALACCFHKTQNGMIFHHIGICIDATNVMHTSAKHGYSVLPVRAFRRLANHVEYYRCVKR